MKAGFWKKSCRNRSSEEQRRRRQKALETRGAQVEAELLRIQSLLPDYQELENLEGRLKKAEADRKKLESASDFWQEKRKAGKEETEELKKVQESLEGTEKEIPDLEKRLRELTLRGRPARAFRSSRSCFWAWKLLCGRKKRPRAGAGPLQKAGGGV